MLVIPNRGRVVAVMVALALVGGLLTLALLAKPTLAEPPKEKGGATSESFEIGFMLDATACKGEVIQMTGTLHAVNHLTGDYPDGTYHLKTHYNLQGVKGAGLDPVTLKPTGTEYIIPSAGGWAENRVQSGQTVSGTVDIILAIGKGQIPNQDFFARVHYIIEDGTVKTEHVGFHLKCQPGNASPTATASATATANAADTKASPTATKASPTATSSPGTGGASLAMGAGVLLVGAGFAARRYFL